MLRFFYFRGIVQSHYSMNKLILLAFASLCSYPLQAQWYQYANNGKRVVEETGNNAVDKEKLNLHFQTTYIYQYKPEFNSPYTGINSLKGTEETQNSVTTTLYLGIRLWKGAALYINPELAGGSGLSGALGMGGSSNGETFRVGSPSPTLYLARAYYQQTFALNKEGSNNLEPTESDANQLSGYEPKRYIRLYAGKFSLGDLFDKNEYSNSPKEQFMNWALMNNGAWDYAANVRGYTAGLAAELKLDKMRYRLAYVALPNTANGQDLNDDLAQAYSINAEAEREITIKNKPGHIRLLTYYNTANMGNYEQSVNDAITINAAPDLLTSGKYGNNKLGIGLNADQQLSNTLGVFARVGWNDGNNETWCFTEIDHTASLGLSLNGKAWNRETDHAGIAIVANGLSKEHQRYLVFGGSGFMLGDGALNYAPECIVELYYNFKPVKVPIWFSGDYQFCMNPGYNADRGPVHIFSVRAHIAF